MNCLEMNRKVKKQWQNGSQRRGTKYKWKELDWELQIIMFICIYMYLYENL